MSPTPVLLVLGSGPGIGISVAKLFAQKHFAKIVLVSRNAERLEKEKAEVQQAAKQVGRDVEVTTHPTDLTDLPQLGQTLKEVERLGKIGCIFFNAARVRFSQVLTSPVEELEEDFKTTNLALYIVAQWGIPLLQKSGLPSPTIIVTNSLLPEHPYPEALSLSAVKASQQNIVWSLRASFGKEIHIGLIKVGGIVSPEAKNLNPTRIAEETVGFYEQGREQWGEDVVIYQ